VKSRLLSSLLPVALLTLGSAAAGGAAERQVVADHLVQQAWSTGAARVIVQFNAPFSVDAELAGGHPATGQRQGIASTRAAVTRGLRGLRHRIVREYDALPFVAIEAGPDALQMLQTLKGLVARVDEDVPDRSQLAQSGPVVQAPQAWAGGHNGAGTIVAVLDTGVMKTHPFLAGKVVAEACFSSQTTNRGYAVTSVCPGGAAFAEGPGAGVNCAAAVEGCDHGTHVAGIVAGGATGTIGSGVAPGARIMAVQVFSRFPAAHPACDQVHDCVLSFTSDQLAALNYVLDHRSAFPGETVASINMSLAGGHYTANCDADVRKHPIDLLRAAGIATVVASGNDGDTDSMGAPACISSAVSVGATGDGSYADAPLDQVSYFSNSASFLSLLAPGWWIASSVPPPTSATGYANFAGTSMATPHVAAALAILRQAAPWASVDSLVEALQSTGRLVTDTRVGGGQIKPRIRVNARSR
jgi:subtilisin family serine protease